MGESTNLNWLAGFLPSTVLGIISSWCTCWFQHDSWKSNPESQNTHQKWNFTNKWSNKKLPGGFNLIIWKILVKLEIFPKSRGENTKSLKPPRRKGLIVLASPGFPRPGLPNAGPIRSTWGGQFWTPPKSAGVTHRPGSQDINHSFIYVFICVFICLFICIFWFIFESCINICLLAYVFIHVVSVCWFLFGHLFICIFLYLLICLFDYVLIYLYLFVDVLFVHWPNTCRKKLGFDVENPTFWGHK